MIASFCASLACAQLRPTARRAMRVKSKCGRTFCSASCTTLVMLPDCRSLSALMIARTSSVVLFTSASGVSWAAASAGASASRNVARIRNMEGLPLAWHDRVRLNARAGVPVDLLLARVVLRLAEQELADELLQHHRRLRDGDAISRGELLVVAAGVEADVGLAQQARGEDRRGGVLGKRVALVEREGHARLVALVVEVDVGHAAHEHAGAAHRAAHLQAADVVEARLDAVGLGGALRPEDVHAKRQHQQRAEARGDEGAAA